MSTHRDKFFDLSQHLFWTVDAHGDLQDANPAWWYALGWRREELVGHAMADFLREEDRTLAQDLALAASSAEGGVEGYCGFCHRLGGYRWFKVTGRGDSRDGLFYGMGSEVTDAVVQAAKGQVMGAVVADVAELRQQESEEKINTLVALIESSTEFFAYYDTRGTPLYVNACAREQFGWGTTSEMADHYPPEALRVMTDTALPAAASGMTWESENFLLNRRTGEKVPVWQRVFSLKDHHGLPRYFATIATDMRQRKAAESALVQSSKMASLGLMASGIAHEVNNPLAIIQGKVQQLRKRAPDEAFDMARLKKDLEMIEDMTKRIVKIIKGLRSFSRRGENDPFTLASLSSMVEDTLELCAERFRHHAIPIRLRIDDLMLACQPVQVSQVLLNLMNNAFDAVVNLPDPWVELVAEDRGDHVRIVIRDAGRGIPEAIREKIMDPFFTTKDVGKGTGLGLSISRGIVEHHEGRIWLEASDPHTCFVIQLPKDFGLPVPGGNRELPVS